MSSLQEQLQRAHDRIAELEEVIGMTSAVRDAHMRYRLLALLVARPIVSNDAALIALYGNLPESEQPDGSKIIHVMICKLRKELKREGVEIFTRYGQGYFLNDTGKVYARRYLAGINKQ